MKKKGSRQTHGKDVREKGWKKLESKEGHRLQIQVNKMSRWGCQDVGVFHVGVAVPYRIK